MTLRITQQLYDGAGFYHVIVSPPQHWAREMLRTEDGFKIYKKKVREVLLMVGAVGGVQIVHPYRRKKGSLTDWYLSPHSHNIVMGNWIDSSKAPPGWIVEVKYNKDGFEVPTRQFYRLAYYLISHAGAIEGGTVANYFGVCSSAGKFSKVKAAVFTEKRYRKCGTEGCLDGFQYLYLDWDKHRRYGDDLHPIEDVWTWTVWCLRKDKDEIQSLIQGLSLDEVLDLNDPRLYIEYPNGEKEFDLDTDGEGLRLGSLDDEDEDESFEEKAAAKADPSEGSDDEDEDESFEEKAAAKADPEDPDPFEGSGLEGSFKNDSCVAVCNCDGVPNLPSIRQ